jgi:N-acetylglucosamine-6-phosphate deacetylase
MKSMRIRARHYATSQPVEIICDQGTIASIASPSRQAVDLEAGWVAPALFDLQINGCGGHSFNSDRLTVENVRQVVNECLRHGIGGFCPTVVTNSFAGLAHGLTTIRRACETDSAIARVMPAIHLEGPYISAEDGPRGAHPLRYVRPPDWDEFCRLQEAAGGRIRLVTLAPELNGALAFIGLLVDSGVVAALGHTAASPQRIRDAITAGARLSTHLGNACHALLPRHDNYLWEQLAADELWASIISDGFHLPAALVRCIVRMKSPLRTILTCDASSLAGLPPGRYREWDQELEVLLDGRIIVVDSGFLAGSGSFTDRCIGNVIRFAGVSLEEAVDMAGARPRELLGLPFLRLEAGQPADLVLFDWKPGGEFQVCATVLEGTIVYSERSPSAPSPYPLPPGERVG